MAILKKLKKVAKSAKGMKGLKRLTKSKGFKIAKGFGKVGLKLAGGATLGKAALAVGAVAGVGALAKKFLGGKKKAGSGGSVGKSTRSLLKKKYDQRARKKIRMGNLGGARRDLRKKMTI